MFLACLALTLCILNCEFYRYLSKPEQVLADQSSINEMLTQLSNMFYLTNVLLNNEPERSLSGGFIFGFCDVLFSLQLLHSLSLILFGVF